MRERPEMNKVVEAIICCRFYEALTKYARNKDLNEYRLHYRNAIDTVNTEQAGQIFINSMIPAFYLLDHAFYRDIKLQCE